jgi:uroporphyrinogen-III synthase
MSNRTHNVAVNQTSAQVVDSYNTRTAYQAPAPIGAQTGDKVTLTSSDGVQFLARVAAADNETVSVRVTG